MRKLSLLILLTAAASAQPLRYEVKRAAGAIAIDGKVEEAAWQAAAPLEGSGAKSCTVGDHGGMPRLVPVEELFAGRHFDAEIVVLCVRWYLSFKLSYRDLVSMMGERGINLAHTTILRWVQHYTPEFEKRWKRFARPVGGSWRMDETYVKVRGEWVYLYRAVDKEGKTVDFLLSRQRDINAAKAFLRKAMKGRRVPAKVTLDAYAASHRAVADLKRDGELPKEVVVRSSKYLNNLIEQDHRRIKQRLRPMLGLKSFQTADIVIGGIELAEKIKKGQFKTEKPGGRLATMPEIWRAALAA
jgi:transposase-like protein